MNARKAKRLRRAAFGKMKDVQAHEREMIEIPVRHKRQAKPLEVSLETARGTARRVYKELKRMG